MIEYRFLMYQAKGPPPAPFGVAFRDDEGVFLFVPEWRGPRPLPVKDLKQLDKSHVPTTVYPLEWSAEIGRWEGPHEDFHPITLMRELRRRRRRGASGSSATPPAPPLIPEALVFKPAHFPSTPPELMDLILTYGRQPILWCSVEAKGDFEKGVARAHVQLKYSCIWKDKHHFCEELARLAKEVVVPTFDDGPRIAFNSTNLLLARTGLFPRPDRLGVGTLQDQFCVIAEQRQTPWGELAWFLQKNWN